jgi:tRNA(Ile)-lysidine synthase
MNVKLEKYIFKKICVAVSGGKDSMALLDYLYNNSKAYCIEICALNCDHGIRGEQSERDSLFVSQWCREHSIPLVFFKANGFKSEEDARRWRLMCYKFAATPHDIIKDVAPFDGATFIEFYNCNASWGGADCIATAHHLNDNAETVLFNLARGSSLSGLKGICDMTFTGEGGAKYSIVRPLIECSRGDIDEYIQHNNIPYVVDESNLTDDYTRNYIRHNVLPALENAVPGATKAIYRFSRIAADDEEYFSYLLKDIISGDSKYGYKIQDCNERVVFKRAAARVINVYKRKDYTAEQIERLYNLQLAENGKKFEFLGLTAFKENGRIVIVDDKLFKCNNVSQKFREFLTGQCDDYCGQFIKVCASLEMANMLTQTHNGLPFKILQFDASRIPDDAEVRFMQSGDRFEKFGGGTKNLGDYMTDKKIPARLRGLIPIIAHGNNVLLVGGVEISKKIMVTPNSDNVKYIVCADYVQLSK